MKKNSKILAGLALAATAIIIMLFSTMPSAGSKEITITDLSENAAKYQDDYIMTQGLLKKETVKWDADKLELHFDIYDESGKEIMPIFYKGVKPDNFSDDVIIIVEGFIQKDGVFHAEKVQTKCPSKYEGKDYDEEKHKEIFNDKKQ
ncbi:cytochrome c maturation protein CcmE [Mesobacillus zeae]|uniref:Cytochrome c maturation protein CcmE n=1 Tax=Mesobacillus zeae TaxID=1917180 RepID=A0A398AZQ4_9BACI|nr:cytochrome c maturation protein CcmE [Mesobacillus zeae]RID83055.1 cytochrome c maturation protein CcmE [Mesobacillus zeae]